MNYEQRLKEVLKAVKELQEANPSDDGIQNWVEEKFPELHESWDERIRKEILEYFQQFENEGLRGINISDWIAWLEKQKSEEINVKALLTADRLAAAEMTGRLKERKDIVENPQKYGLEKQGEQKEPMFRVGDWVIINNNVNSTYQVEKIENYEYTLRHFLGGSMPLSFSHEDMIRAWTIQDAKDGDMLSYVTDEEDLWIMIYWSLYEPYEGHVHYHALLVNNNFSDKGTCCICIDNLKPATKEQRDTLMKAMTDAGYTFDFEKKELKKLKFRVGDEVITENEESLTITRIDEEGYWSNDLFICNFDSECNWDLVEQKPIEKINGEDYGIDSLWHAQRILEKTLGNVDGYQSDDGILEHKCAISAVKKLYEHKPTEWKQENREELTEFENAMMHIGGSFFGENAGLDPNDSASIKEQAELLLELASKTEWSEEDERMCQNILECLRNGWRKLPTDILKYESWLKSIKQMVTWKPSDEQMEALEHFIIHHNGSTNYAKDLEELRIQLKKLKGE